MSMRTVCCHLPLHNPLRMPDLWGRQMFCHRQTFLLTKPLSMGVSVPFWFEETIESSGAPWYAGLATAQAGHILLTLRCFFPLNWKIPFCLYHVTPDITWILVSLCRYFKHSFFGTWPKLCFHPSHRTGVSDAEWKKMRNSFWNIHPSFHKWKLLIRLIASPVDKSTNTLKRGKSVTEISTAMNVRLIAPSPFSLKRNSPPRFLSPPTITQTQKNIHTYLNKEETESMRNW